MRIAPVSLPDDRQAAFVDGAVDGGDVDAELAGDLLRGEPFALMRVCPHKLRYHSGLCG
jgi:hypothetical protein